jgi:hypothetical protein
MERGNRRVGTVYRGDVEGGVVSAELLITGSIAAPATDLKAP